MDYFYEGIHRLDWGFGNPNMTAALIAMLAVAICGVALVWKKLFWFAIPVTTGLLVALIHTLSRGGMVAFLVGFIALVIAIRPRLDRKRIITLVCLAMILVGYAHHLGGAARYVQGINGLEDRSLENRWLIYKSIPRMLLNAPGGWGKGNAADAYHQWYQEEGRSETYLNLVNSHFTWLVEWPTWARLLYCIGWAFVFSLAWPCARHRWRGIVLAVWITFFIASCFSSVAHRLWIWPLPISLFLVVMFHRYLVGSWRPQRRSIGIAASAGVASYLLLLLLALIPSGIPPIHHHKDSTTVGSSQASERIALCGNDRSILGEKLGHRLRAYVKQHPDRSVTLFETPAKIHGVYQTTVLAGDAYQKFMHCSGNNLLFLNPSNSPGSFNFQDFKTAKVLWGSMNPSYAWYAWQAKAAQTPGLELVKQPGEGMYLENWLDQL